MKINIFSSTVNRGHGKELEQTFIWTLKRVLEKYNIKQTDFAKSIGVSKQTLYHYLTGRRSLDLETVCTIINSLKALIPKFNFVYLFDNTQDIVTHEQTNYIYDEKGTIIAKLKNENLDLLHKMLRNEYFPSFIKSITKYYSVLDAANHENISISEQIMIDTFIGRHASTRVILKYLIMLLYSMAPEHHEINRYYDEISTVANQLPSSEKKELSDIASYLAQYREREKNGKLSEEEKIANKMFKRTN